MIDLKNGKVDLSHGSGGRGMAQLIDALFVKHFNNDLLNQGNDQAIFNVETVSCGHDSRLACDYLIVFPGGDIGSLAVYGTVNDVVMSGAKPPYYQQVLFWKKGFHSADLEKNRHQYRAAAAKQAGTLVITGDTKVVERGKGDGVFIYLWCGRCR